MIYGFEQLFEAAEFERLDQEPERGGHTMTMRQAQQPAPKAPSRMQLSAVTRGRVERAPRVLLYGVEGVGKSTFAANAPAPIFLAAEDGTGQLDVARFPEPQGWPDVLEAVEQLTVGDHDFKTLAIDTVDWLEPMIWNYLITRANKSDIKSIEDFGYGKGYTAALDEWRVLLAALERLRNQRGMGVIMLAHSWIKPYKNPEGDDFDRFELKLNNKASGLLKEWCDAVLFTRFETFVAKDSKTKRVRGISSGERVIHTVRTAAYDAKNRYDLPEVMPLDYEAFAQGVASRAPISAEASLSRIEGLLVGASNERTAKVRAAIASAKGDAAQLARVADKLAAAVNIAAEQQENAQ